MDSKSKNGLLALLAIILFLPMLQKAFPFIKSAPLNGEYITAPDTVFTVSKWLDGTYWDKKSKYINDNMGFRPDFIRLNNQIDYSLFHKFHSEWRLMGEDNCIFQDVYIYSYLGRDYNGYPYIYKKVRKLKAIQDTLQKLGKSLIFIQAPNKADFYKEYIPERYKDTIKSTSNYDTYKRVADSIGLNQIDFNSWFVSLKGKSNELLYPKGGFHWSYYGATLAADSLVKYMEQLRHIHMPHLYWDRVEHTTHARYKDDDIAKSMNLIAPLNTETFAYPEIKYYADNTTTKPRVLYIGDSFLFQWLDYGILDNINSHWRIWYYTSALVDHNHPQAEGYPMDEQEFLSRLDSTDCVVIVYTGRNLDKLGKTFVEETYAHFYPGMLN